MEKAYPPWHSSSNLAFPGELLDYYVGKPVGRLQSEN